MNKCRIKLVKSKFGRKPGHRESVEGLGLRKINDEVVRDLDDPCINGMVKAAHYMLSITPAE